MFWKKKKEETEINSQEYETLLRRLLEVKHEISALNSKFEALQTNYNDLRGKFNRKLNIIKDQEGDHTETQLLNTLNPFKI
jgi:predicted transcriptional regulator